MVEHHLLASRDIELVVDELLDDVPGQLRIALEDARRRRAPALVAVAVLVRRADRERRHLVEEEVQPVVDAEQHDDVRLVVGEPAAHGNEAVEERLPGGFLLLGGVEYAAETGDM